MESLRSKIQSIFSRANISIKTFLDTEDIDTAFELGYIMAKLEIDILAEVEKNDR